MKKETMITIISIGAFVVFAIVGLIGMYYNDTRSITFGLCGILTNTMLITNA